MILYKDHFYEEEWQEFVVKLTPERYVRRFRNPFTFFIGGFKGSELIGFGGGGFLKNPNAAAAILSELYVLPKYQGIGLSRPLYQAMEQEAFRKKARIWIESFLWDIDYHVHFGYKVIDSITHLDRKLVFMEKARPDIMPTDLKIEPPENNCL